MDAYDLLEVKRTDDRETIRQAYHEKVKRCHPDLYSDPGEKERARAIMVELNLAYEEILSEKPEKSSGVQTLISTEKALSVAQKMLEHNQPESALRQLARASVKTAEWFCMEGRILMALKQYSTAHQAFRAAVRMDPDESSYRAFALDAAIAVKKHQKLYWKMADWAEDLVRPHRRSRTKEQKDS